MNNSKLEVLEFHSVADELNKFLDLNEHTKGFLLLVFC